MHIFYLESELAGVAKDGGSTGIGLCFRIPAGLGADGVEAGNIDVE